MKTVTGGSLPAAIWKQVMTAAEVGKPSKPLDMSPVQAPTDNSILGTDNNSAAPTDDEAAPMQGGQSPQKSFWNWIFGGGQQAHQQPSPAVPPQADPNDPNAEAGPPPDRDQYRNPPPARDQYQGPQPNQDDDQPPPPPPGQPPPPPPGPG